MSRQRSHGRRLGPNGECGVCHQPHVRANNSGGSAITCAAHRQPSNGGGPCKKYRPADGGDTWICDTHGGNTPQVVAKRARDRQRAEVEKLMVTLGEPINDGRDYSEVIADRVAMRRGHVAWLLERVRTLDPDAIAWGITKRKTAVALDRPSDEQDAGHQRKRFAGNDEGDTFEAKPSIWYAMYTEASRDLEKLCLEAVRVGIEARRLQMDERMADQWVRVIDGIVTALGHDPNAPETAEIVATHLELVA